jgi:hypothetical protein
MVRNAVVLIRRVLCWLGWSMEGMRTMTFGAVWSTRASAASKLRAAGAGEDISRLRPASNAIPFNLSRQGISRIKEGNLNARLAIVEVMTVSSPSNNGSPGRTNHNDLTSFTKYPSAMTVCASMLGGWIGNYMLILHDTILSR